MCPRKHKETNKYGVCALHICLHIMLEHERACESMHMCAPSLEEGQCDTLYAS